MAKIRRTLREIGFGLSIIATLMLVIVSFPIIIPIVAFSQWRELRRMRAAARDFACLNCGQRLGEEAITLGDEAWARKMAEHEGPWIEDVGLRMVRQLHAVCPHCGAQYEYVREKRTFVPAPRESS
jgi:hypothetical protein